MKTQFERAAGDEELYQHAPAPAAMAIDPADGMPRHVNLTVMLAAPALTIESLVCMADTRAFVLRDEWGLVLETFAGDDDVVEITPGGQYRVRTRELLRRRGARYNWFGRLVSWFARLLTSATDWTALEPIRPACQHYARSLLDIAGDAEHKFVQRVCLKQRSDTGEYLSLRDAAVYACEIREPRHRESEDELERGDAKRITAATDKRKQQQEFDPEAELAKLAQEGGGIFGGKV